MLPTTSAKRKYFKELQGWKNYKIFTNPANKSDGEIKKNML